MHRTAPRGFTLIELLVVIAIIGILSAVVVASLNTAREKGYDAQRVSNLRSVEQALEVYATNAGGYPSTGGGSNYVSQCSAWGGVSANNVIPGLVASGGESRPSDRFFPEGGGE